MRHATPVLVAILLAGTGSIALAGDPPAAAPGAPPPAPVAPAPPPKRKAPLPPGIVARAGTREIPLSEFHVHLARVVKDELEDARSGPATVLQMVIEETIVRQEAARLGIIVSQRDYEDQRKVFDDQLREKSGGTQTLDDVLKLKQMSEEEFRERTEDVVRKERIASNPAWMGASLPKDPNQRIAQIELVMRELMKRAKVERTGLKEGIALLVNGQPITEESFGRSLDRQLSPSEVARHLQRYCFTILMGAEATKITDAQVEEELETARPLWLLAREEAVDPQYQGLTFEAFLQMRFNAPIEELKRSAYHRGIFWKRRELRAAIQPDEVRAAWIRGADDEYGPSISVSEVVVGFTASNSVSEPVKRRNRDDAMRILRDYERRIRGGEPAATIERELKEAKERGERGVVFARRVLLHRGNDLLLFEAAGTIAKDGDWAPPIELQSEAHLMRRDAYRPAPTFEKIAAVVRERLVDQRASEWFAAKARDDVTYAVR